MLNWANRVRQGRFSNILIITYLFFLQFILIFEIHLRSFVVYKLQAISKSEGIREKRGF
jgi:hypothetical protein